MTRNPASVSMLTWAGILASSTVLASPALGPLAPDPDHPPAVVASHRFDISAQPLADAVRAYGLVTGLSVLANSADLRGRTSAALHETLTAREALERMLAGTQLQGRFPRANAVVIFPRSEEASTQDPAVTVTAAGGPVPLATVDGVRANGDDYQGYVSHLQARLVRSLCASPATQPGSYRLAVQLRIDAAGAVIAVHRAAGTQGSQRDAAVERALRHLSLEPPPRGLPQPVTLLLRSDGDGVATHCPSDALGAG